MIKTGQKGFTRQNLNKVSSGFTLVELMLAMAFFSFILLFITSGFLLVNRAYNKGLTVKLVQNEGRKLIEELTREVRVSNSLSIVTDNNLAKCIEVSGYRYYWSVPISSASGSPGNLYKEEGRDCSASINTSAPRGVQVLDDRVGVQYMSLTRLGASSPIYTIRLVLSTSETDLLNDPGEGANCSTGSGSQYCDIVDFTTVVTSR